MPGDGTPRTSAPLLNGALPTVSGSVPDALLTAYELPLSRKEIALISREHVVQRHQAIGSKQSTHSRSPSSV